MLKNKLRMNSSEFFETLPKDLSLIHATCIFEIK